MWEMLRHLHDNPANITPYSKASVILVGTFLLDQLDCLGCIGFVVLVVYPEELLHLLISLIKELQISDLVIWLYVSETCKLVEMSSESVPGVENSLISSTNETAAFDHVVPAIEGGGREILVNGMDFEVLEWVDGGWTVLPDVADNIIKFAGFEHVDWIRRKPVLHVDIAYLAMFPI